MYFGKILEKQIIYQKGDHFHQQKQPSRGVPRKRFPENMHQIYRRTPMLKSDLLKSHFDMRVLLYICYIFLEQLFSRTPLDGCFRIKLSKLWKIDAKILGTQIWRHITAGLQWNLNAIQLLIKIKPDFADGADFYRLKKSLWFLTR